jgi:hypothetical protein
VSLNSSPATTAPHPRVLAAVCPSPPFGRGTVSTTSCGRTSHCTHDPTAESSCFANQVPRAGAFPQVTPDSVQESLVVYASTYWDELADASL